MYECDDPDWTEIWQVVTKAQILESDAYYSIATICVVVLEMQLYKEVDQGYSTSIYMSAAIENLAELEEYGLVCTSNEAPTQIVKTVKYVYRALYSLQKALGPDVDQALTQLVGIAQKANVDRGNIGFIHSKAFKSYRKSLCAMIETIQTQTHRACREY
jgi:hypothetical protein